jgi:uncharacterized protein (DUF934 family)
MPLIKDGEAVEERFLRIEDDAPLPRDGAVLLTAKQFLDRAQELTGRAGPVGVIWPNDRDIAELAPYLDSLALVALVFPSFRDGRAYSQARTLRDRYGFRGEVRATGDVLRDQFLLMHRAGFDAYEVRKPADAAAFCEALQRYNVFYQPVAGEGVSALRRRLNAASRQQQAVVEPV